MSLEEKERQKLDDLKEEEKKEAEVLLLFYCLFCIERSISSIKKSKFRT